MAKASRVSDSALGDTRLWQMRCRRSVSRGIDTLHGDHVVDRQVGLHVAVSLAATFIQEVGAESKRRILFARHRKYLDGVGCRQRIGCENMPGRRNIAAAAADCRCRLDPMAM